MHLGSPGGQQSRSKNECAKKNQLTAMSCPTKTGTGCNVTVGSLPSLELAGDSWGVGVVCW